MSRAQWRWEFVDRADRVRDRPASPVFTSRFDAEQWLGEHWRQLAAEHLARARLLGGDEPVGPPVLLAEA